MSELPYLRVFGHAPVKENLARALRAGRLPPTLLLHGPRGVGKQRLALWFAALVQCERGEEEPCGRCRPCQLAGRLVHPDIHWFFPTERPRAVSPDKMREKIEELRAEELELRRRNPHYTTTARGPVGIYLAAAQNLRALVSARPAMARQSVTVVGDAESLVPQEASPEAANALLKVLEEPPHSSRILLTSSIPGALLPTIRSRCLELHISPLTEEEVARFVAEQLATPRRDAALLARRAQGSIGRALELASEESEEVRKEARGLLDAARASSAVKRLDMTHQFAPFGARGDFLDVLEELQTLLREELRRRAGGNGPGPAPGTHDLPAAILAVQAARGMAERNVNPQLIVAGLLARLNILLSGEAGRPPPTETPGNRRSSQRGSTWAKGPGNS